MAAPVVGDRPVAMRDDAGADAPSLLCPEAVREPERFFARLRERQPVWWSATHRAWVVTRHADIVAALRSPHFTAERIRPFRERPTSDSGSDRTSASAPPSPASRWRSPSGASSTASPTWRSTTGRWIGIRPC